MKSLNNTKKRLFLPTIGFIFAIFASIFTPVLDVFAVPESNQNQNSTQDHQSSSNSNQTTNSQNQANQNSDSTTEQSPEDQQNQQNQQDPEQPTAEEQETKDLCFDQIGAIGWLVCPGVGVIAKTIDSIYSVISDLLNVKPLHSDTSSPIYLVWEYIRNISNIVFIIFILIIIYSQLTGLGISNYGIKRTLPRLIVSAILINLSFIICAVAVDVSNIVGTTFRGVFSSIQQMVVANGGIESTAKVSWVSLVAAITGGGAIGAIAIGASGGAVSFLLALVPIIVSALLSIIIGLITISLRQALISILVMLAPLAFISYLFPNTEKYFKEWRKLFTQMLVFFPMFSIIYGGAELAGWTIIASASNGFWIILGMAIQILPLFLTFSLLKMSGTILDRFSGNINGPVDRARAWSEKRRAIAANEYTAKHSTRKFNPLSGGSWRALASSRNFNIKDHQRTSADNLELLNSEKLLAKKTGNRIIGYSSKGTPIYSSRTQSNKHMRREFTNRELNLRLEGQKLRTDNTMSTMSDYLDKYNIKDDRLAFLATRQGQNFINYKTEISASKRNARADERFYLDKIKEAATTDSSGNIVNQGAFNRLIVHGAGADAYGTENLPFSALSNTQHDAIISTIADAYDIYERERQATIARYTTYFERQVTKDILPQYDRVRKDKNIDAIIAAHNVLGRRGDFDIISSGVSEIMNNGDAELTSDFTNSLALNLLSMKDAAPALGRLGKFINMETAAYSNGERTEKNITMSEYITGVDASGRHTKINIVTGLEGTSFKNIDRTAFKSIETLLESHFKTPDANGKLRFATQADEDAYYSKLEEITNETIMPQLISAMPGFSSGSEQIIGVGKLFSQMSYNADIKKWGKYKKDSLGNYELDANGDYVKDLSSGEWDTNATSKSMIDKYLKSISPSDLTGMKSNIFDAIIARLSVEFGNEQDAIDYFRQSQIDNHNLERLRNGSPHAYHNMKDKIKQALGL